MSRIPVSIITGFLGSGKTTLINRLLRQPDLSATAVIVNEFGEIGLDHELVEASDGSVVLLPNGCLCCAVRGDFVRTLDELHRRRAQNSIMRFTRVVVETSGLADPGPIIEALLGEPSVHARYLIDSVLTTVDVVNGAATIQTHLEAVKQVAVADRIVLTKQDLLAAETAGATVQALVGLLRDLNPAAVIDTAPAAIDAILRGAPFDPGQKNADVQGWLRDHAYDARPLHHHGNDGPHSARVRSFCIVRDDPIDEAALAMFLEAITKYLGPGLLRLKGIVHVAQRAEQPAVVQGAQSLLHQLAWLERWPGPDRRTRLVFITLDIGQEEIDEMLALLERMQANTNRARARAASLTMDSPPPDALSKPSHRRAAQACDHRG